MKASAIIHYRARLGGACFHTIVLLFLFAVADNAWAQIRPDAGQTLRELERTNPPLQAPAKEGPQLSITPEISPQKSPDNTKVTVRLFQITGATSISGNELMPLLEEWINRELTL